jgi:hypothetical protein
MWRWLGWRGLVAAVTAITGVLACRQLVGITGNPSTDLVTSICGLPYGTSTCASCVNTNCCAEANTCAVDPTCAAYESCLGACNGDPKCRSQCTIDNPTGTASDVSALSACLAGKCETACGLQCGGIAELISPPDAAVACQQCLKSTCSQAQACASSETCDGFERCPLAGETYDSLVSCETALGFTYGDSDAGMAAPDFTGACAAACAQGDYWSCLGHVNWLPPKSPTVTYQFYAADYNSEAPLSGMDVSVCGPTDMNCTQPFGSGQTVANGYAAFQVQNPTQATTGLGINGYLQLSLPGYVPELLFWGFPLSEATEYNNWRFVTPVVEQELEQAAGVMQDPTRGLIEARVWDCRLNIAPGVVVTADVSDAGVSEFYGLPGTSKPPTDTTGLVFFDNVPAGSVTLTATPVAIGRPSSQATVLVRAGWVTDVEMWVGQSP